MTYLALVLCNEGGWNSVFLV